MRGLASQRALLKTVTLGSVNLRAATPRGISPDR